MNVALDALLVFYQFTTGRAILALAGVSKAIGEGDYGDLDAALQHIAKAQKHLRATRSLELAFAQGQNQSKGNPALVAIDVRLDKAVTGLRNGLQAIADAGGADAEIATTILGKIFPKGLVAITQATFVDQLSLVDGVLAEIKANHAPMIQELGLQKHVDRVAAINEEYRTAQLASSATVGFDQVRASRARGDVFLREVVALVLGKFPFDTKEDVAARQALLGPVIRQNDAIAGYLRARRAVEDVNPDTGATEPAPQPAAPVQPPAPAPAG